MAHRDYEKRLERFMPVMRGQFQANEDKEGWMGPVNDPVPSWILPHLRECVNILERAMNEAEPGETLEESRARIRAAAGDVANMALIACDAARCLPTLEAERIALGEPVLA